MKQRLLTTFIGIPLVLCVMYLYHTPIYDLVLLAACLVGYGEAFRAYRQKQDLILQLTVSILTAVWLGGKSFGIAALQTQLCAAVLCLCLLTVLILYTLAHFTQITLVKTAGALLLCGLLFFCVNTVYGWKQAYSFEKYGYLGAFLFLLSLAYAWGGDGLALLVGKAFGKRKLCPSISPNKTVAGAFGAPLGSILFGLLFLWIYALLMPSLQPDALLVLSPKMYLLTVVVAIPASMLGMTGDLFFSCIKRQAGIKDYGALFPGQGGIFDRFDSVIPVCALVSVCVKALGI